MKFPESNASRWSPVARGCASVAILAYLAAVIVPPLAGPAPASELASRILQPLRPLVDLLVRRYEGPAEPGLTPATKRYLYPVLTSTVNLDGERLPIFAALEQYAANVRRCFLAEGKRLDCPEGLQLP